MPVSSVPTLQGLGLFSQQEIDILEENGICTVEKFVLRMFDPVQSKQLEVMLKVDGFVLRKRTRALFTHVMGLDRPPGW